uniref:Polyketide synthase n=1 Tax=Peronospora matthiolae TaxID=2874970 RepID=A0AAV1TY37_9STRA
MRLWAVRFPPGVLTSRSVESGTDATSEVEVTSQSDKGERLVPSRQSELLPSSTWTRAFRVCYVRNGTDFEQRPAFFQTMPAVASYACENAIVSVANAAPRHRAVSSSTCHWHVRRR